MIRAIEPRDKASWAALFSAYGVFYKTAFSEQIIDGVWAWLMDADHEVKALVAVEQVAGRSEVVGFAIYRRLADTFRADVSWHLDDLYVQPEHRGAGVAAALIEAVAERASAAGGGTLRWITAHDNERAQRVYDRLATRMKWVTYERELD